ncbi:hypothetical protein [Shewanella surugensis]|uniref:Glycosyltransferase RgtA/B/C/D-like domain-containing protein n=1 Tax=Shewanella surugensis TaxID=212020 RepID=A0ABT0LIE0_9GAMM|nr:hypothetical protein [Shewanella surugensis]MCL1127454.1 hypothetical protein [Shewanella surugensis]
MIDEVSTPKGVRLSKADWKMIIFVFLLSRLFIYFIGLVASRIYGGDNTVLAAFCRFDCVWYQRIMQFGYDLAPQWLSDHNAANWAFMPVYPLLAKGVNIFFNSPILSLYLISNVSFFMALTLILMLSRQMGFAKKGYFPLWLLAFSPYSVYFVSGYTESLFLALTLAVFLLSYRQQWLYVAVFGLLLAGTRNLGVMSVFPVLIIAVRHYGLRSFFKTNKGLEVIAALWIIPFILFSYMLYLYFLVGDGFAFTHIQIAWTRHIDSPVHWLAKGLSDGGKGLYLVGMVTFGWLINLYLVYRRLWAEAVFVFICTFIPLLTGITAMPRYLFGLAPVYIAFIALSDKKPNLQTALLVLSSACLSFIVTGFVMSKFFTV